MLEARLWEEAREFLTRRILRYHDPVTVLAYLQKKYGSAQYRPLRAHIWGERGVYVVLEDFEDGDLPVFSPWVRTSMPQVHEHTLVPGAGLDGSCAEFFHLSYPQKTAYDYWVKLVSIPLISEPFRLGIRLHVRARDEVSLSLKFNVIYPESRENGIAVSNVIITGLGAWQRYETGDFVPVALRIAEERGWSPQGLFVDKIVLDTRTETGAFYVDNVELYVIDDA